MTSLHASSMRSLTRTDRAAFLATLNDQEAAALLYDWRFWARPEQLPPAGNWQYWLILAGRGFGKTRTICEWARAQAEALPGSRGGIVAATAADARDIVVEGESGLLACCPPWNKPQYEPSKRRVTWPNGTVATVFSADEPDRLRGPQYHWAIADELAAWRRPEAWDMLVMGLRLGTDPRCAIATTPRPTPIIRGLVKDPLAVLTHGSTYDNRGNLAPTFFNQIIRRYEGTRLGRQELNAEILDDNPGALWQRARLDTLRVTQAPDMKRIVVGIDPMGSEAAAEAETGIICGGQGYDDALYILDDASMHASPATWAQAALALYHKWKADRIVAEVNFGGDMVMATIFNAGGQNVPVTPVTASRGKAIRAEPIAALYEQGRAHHVGFFPALEDELCQWEPGAKSPNRLDALVWVGTELFGVGGAEAGTVSTPW